jgi:hypothetical protein
MDLFHIHLSDLVVKRVIVSLIGLYPFLINICFHLLTGITHTEITQLGFVRSLTRFLFETKAIHEHEEYTIDQLYQLMYPTWSIKKLQLQIYPLKSILDTILAENALVDFDRWTKKLPTAHFDSEAFANGSRRILKIRRISMFISFDSDLKVSF